MQESEYRMADFVPETRQGENRYLLDLDGNSWSRRFIPMLHSHNSLIVKTTLFQEYERRAVVPYAHFVPASLDVSEARHGHMHSERSPAHPVRIASLRATLLELASHDEMAEKIAAAGHKRAAERLRKEDMQCYWFRLLIEYADMSGCSVHACPTNW